MATFNKALDIVMTIVIFAFLAFAVLWLVATFVHLAWGVGSWSDVWQAIKNVAAAMTAWVVRDWMRRTGSRQEATR